MSDVTLYWRPGCGYCEQLKVDLGRREIPFTAVNIWAEREKAEIVRQANGGDEVVPTVQIGESFLVNPSPEAVADALARG